MSTRAPKKVQDKNAFYEFLRPYVDVMAKLSYRRFKFVGLDRLPKDGAIILAPNHTNALMDALVVLAMNRERKVFVARADIFKNPAIAKILNFLKIMPIMRVRDGLSEVRKNDETIRKSVDVLRDRVPFCILPEGRHNAQHSLTHVGKGIFRIAFQAQEYLEDENTPVYIIPLGIEYGNFFRYRSTALLKVGEPINVLEYLEERKDKTYPEIMIEMREYLADAMKSLITYIPPDEDYDALYDVCAAVSHHKWRLESRLEDNRANLERIAKAKDTQPEIYQRLVALGADMHKERIAKGISLNSVTARKPLLSRLHQILLAIITLPYSIAGGILTYPIWWVSNFLGKKMKDPAFVNSVKCVLNIALWPILMMVYSIILYCTLPWEWALGISLALLPAPYLVNDTYRIGRLTLSDIRLLCNKRLRGTVNEIRSLFRQLVQD